MSIHKLLIEFHKNFHGAKKTGFNPHFKTEHFTLEDVTKATTPVMNDIGLFVSHRVSDGYLVTGVYDSDGEAMTSAFPLPADANPQILGSAITYGKRYNLCALLNIAEVDDDGEAAAINHPPPASDKTLAELRDFVDSVELTGEQLAFFEAHPIDSLTEPLARKVLARIKAHHATD